MVLSVVLWLGLVEDIVSLVFPDGCEHYDLLMRIALCACCTRQNSEGSKLKVRPPPPHRVNRAIETVRANDDCHPDRRALSLLLIFLVLTICYADSSD